MIEFVVKMTLIKVDTLVDSMASKVGIDLIGITKGVLRDFPKIDVMGVNFFPSWAFGTSATEQTSIITIYLDPALSFDRGCKRENTIKRNAFIISHEMSHQFYKGLSMGEIFRHDILGRPYLIGDVSKEAFSHKIEMYSKDVMVDSTVSHGGEIYRDGFFQTHGVGFTRDEILLKKLEYKKVKNDTDFISLMLSIQRRNAVATILKWEGVLGGLYRDYATKYGKQHFLLQWALKRTPNLQEANYKIKDIFLKFAKKRRGNWKKLLPIFDGIMKFN